VHRPQQAVRVTGFTNEVGGRGQPGVDRQRVGREFRRVEADQAADVKRKTLVVLPVQRGGVLR